MAVVTQTMQDQVTELYLGFFGRAPDAAGFGYWTEMLASGKANVEGIASAFSKTPEFIANYGGLTPDQQVTKIYNNVLNRVPDAGGLAYWTGLLKTGSSIGAVTFQIVDAAFSQVGTADGLLVQNKVKVGEYFAITLASNDTASAATAYNLVTSNPASVPQAEATLVSTTYTLTTNIETINVQKSGAAVVGTQATFQAGDTINGNGNTNLQLKLTDTGTSAWTVPAAAVNGVQTVSLQNLNGSAATAAVAQVETISYTTLTSGITNTTIALQNVAAGGPVTATLAFRVGTWTASDVATAVAAAVNGDATSLYVATLSGSSVVLTAKNAGPVGLAVTSTTTPGLGASGGISNAVVTTAGAAAAPSASQLDTVNASNFVGMTTFVDDNSTGAVTVNNMKAAQTAQINGNGTATNGAFTVNYTATETGTATLNASAGVRGSGVVLAGAAGITATTVNSTGATNALGGLTALGATLNINASSALKTGAITNGPTTIKVSGAATNVTSTAASAGGFAQKVAVDLGTLGAAVTALDASGLTAGGVNVVLNNTITSFKGGAGNDFVTTAGAIPSTAVIAAGAGTDTLIIANATDVNTTAKAAQYTGFEVIEVGYAGTQDMSLFTGLTGVNLNANGASAINLSAAAAGAITVKTTDNAATLSLADATGAADVMSITASSTAAVVNLTALNVSGIETINFTNSSTAANTLSFAGSGTAGVNTGLKTLTLAGAKPVTVDLVTANAVSNQVLALLSVDASALTAAATGTATFTLGQTAAAGYALKNGLTVTGSAGDDSINLSQDTLASGVVVTYNGGAGNDTFTVDAGQLYTAGAGYLVINGGTQASSVGDKVNVISAGGLTAADAAFANMTGIEKLNYASNGAMSLTSGVFFNSAFATDGVTITADAQAAASANTINLTAYTGNSTITLGTNAPLTAAATITGGSGADTVNYASASIGGATVQAFSTGAGNDAITYTNSGAGVATAATVTFNGGAGADTINIGLTNVTGTAGAVQITTKYGESTFSAYDTVTLTGNAKAVSATASEIVKFVFSEPTGTTVSVAANIAAGSGVVGYTAQQLTYGITNGILSFAGTSASGLTAAQVMNIVTSTVDAAQTNGATFAWADTSGNTWLFNHASTDSVVELVGVSGATAVSTTATAGTIFIG